MTASELRYLIALEELYDGKVGVKLTSIAEKCGVTKVSVYRAIERLENNGYVKRTATNKIAISECGAEVLAEYKDCMSVVQWSLESNCKIPYAIAYKDALNTVCCISEQSREAIIDFLNYKGKKWLEKKS